MRYGVLGWPVAHSRSPAMFAAIGAAYQLLPVPPELFEETVRALPAAGFSGANVTIPHKAAALALAAEPTDRAKAIGAANTLTFRDGTIAADNTDAPGFLAALPSSPSGKTALVLGAGGSTRAVVWALCSVGAEVRVWNRTKKRAADLARELGGKAAKEPVAADILVNCTAVGLAGEPLDALPVDPSSYDTIVDLVYAAGGTPLVRAAHEAGATVVDGLDVLAHQGALSYEIWTGHRPNVMAMRSAAEHPE